MNCFFVSSGEFLNFVSMLFKLLSSEVGLVLKRGNIVKSRRRNPGSFW